MYCSRGLGAASASAGQNRAVSTRHAPLIRRSAPCPLVGAGWACACTASTHPAAASNLIKTVAAMHHLNTDNRNPSMGQIGALRQACFDATSQGVVIVRIYRCRAIWTGQG